ncbi:hypothetical protein L195_g046475, partial [Trifolium pratense]
MNATTTSFKGCCVVESFPPPSPLGTGPIYRHFFLYCFIEPLPPLRHFDHHGIMGKRLVQLWDHGAPHSRHLSDLTSIGLDVMGRSLLGL